MAAAAGGKAKSRRAPRTNQNQRRGKAKAAARAAAEEQIGACGFDLRYGAERPDGAVQRDATKLISDLSARDNPRVRLARDQCIPPGALLTGGLGKAKI